MKQVMSVILVVLMLFSAFMVSASAANYESESNNTNSTADVLGLNSTIIGAMGTSNDVDFYKITASSAGKLAVSFNHTYVDNSSVYWNVYLYHYADGQLKELSNKRVYGTSSESIDFPMIGAVSSGTYYIKISTYYDATTKYNYSISNTFSSTNYYEKEFNNSFATATVMNLNCKYSAYMNSSGDSDFYKVTTSSNGKLKLTFNHTYVDNSNVYWNVYLYRYVDGNYTELSYKRIYGSSNESIDFPAIGAVSSGVYYVKVTTYYDATSDCEYSITNSFQKNEYYEKEINNSYATATPITLNNEYFAFMNDDGDSDFYKLSLSTSAIVSFKFNHIYTNNSSVYWNVYVYNYSGGAYNEVAYKRIYGTDSESYSLINNMSLSSGTYYVKITTYYDATTEHEYSIKFSSSTYSSSYTVGYNANGGSVSPSSASVTSGKSTTLPTPTKYVTITYNANGGSNAPSATKAYFDCLGWSTSSSSTSASYACGASYKPTSNVTLYAVWESKAYTNLTSVIPTRSGYTFLGWATSSSATSADFSAGAYVSLKSDDTLYAVWKKIDTTPYFELSSESVVIEKGDYADVTFTLYRNNYEGKLKFRYSISDDNVCSSEWYDGWEGNTCKLKITGNNPGKTTIKVSLMDSNTEEVYEVKEISIEVTDTPEQETYTFFEWLIIIFLFGWIWYI
ncbi:MAG: InlB B-repeat-containing protein [Acutalibacteraceae bacterium]|nr:InlB B-repeat-containing protein [Acutalibacteraceae bacterium]